MQIVAERHRDEVVLMLAKQFEDAHQAHAVWPSFPFRGGRASHL